jgi:translation initiation factor IF-1
MSKAKGKWSGTKSMALNEKGRLMTKDDFNKDGKSTVTYGRVERNFGPRFGVFCASLEKEVQCGIPGKMRGRGNSKRIEAGQIVLVDLNEKEGCNMIQLRYSSDEANRVAKIHEEVRILLNGAKSGSGTAAADIEFGEEEDSNHPGDEGPECIPGAIDFSTL